MIFYISLLECLYMTGVVNSLPQIADVPSGLSSENSRKALVPMSYDLTDIPEAPDSSFLSSENLVPSLSAQTDKSPEYKSSLDLSDLTSPTIPTDSFFSPDNTKSMEKLPDLEMPLNLALVHMIEDPALEDGFGSGGGGVESAPQGGSGSQGSTGTPGGYTGTGAGTGSSGGVNPGAFSPAGGVTPGGGPTPGGPSPGGVNTPAGATSPAHKKTPARSGRVNAAERARRRKKAEESDKNFDCSRMETPADQNRLIGDSSQLLMGRNPRSRFCCTGGPPTSGMWDGIFYTNSPGKFVTLRTNCIEYDPEDPYCWPVENRMCGFCLRQIDNGVWVLYDAYSPFFTYISPTVTLPDQYQESFSLRDIPEIERQQRGRAFWNGPRREGPGGAKTSICPDGYLKTHPYQPA